MAAVAAADDPLTADEQREPFRRPRRPPRPPLPLAGAELRMSTALELEMCRFQGGHATRIAAKLARDRVQGVE